MKEQKKIHFNSSLKEMNENIHWNSERQQHARKMFLSKLKQESIPKRKSCIKRSLLPILASVLFLGIITTLFLSENSVTQQQSEPIVESNKASQGFDIGMDEEVEASIIEINQSAFDLRLPQYTSIENTELKNVWLRDSGATTVVTATYFGGEGNELFTFMQEDISGLDANAVGDATDRMEGNADYITEINGNITFISENDQSGLITINIVTNDYGFTLSTYTLSDEQLLAISESINAN